MIFNLYKKTDNIVCFLQSVDKLPILKKYNVKAAIFIVTDYIGKTIDGKKFNLGRMSEDARESACRNCES